LLTSLLKLKKEKKKKKKKVALTQNYMHNVIHYYMCLFFNLFDKISKLIKDEKN
jgi:hypothetical protein